jgi:MFS family permease
MSMESHAVTAAGAVHSHAHDATFRVTEGYRRYVVWLLFAVYVLNFVDRQILTILIQPIKQEFGFSDTQLGLLGGLAFALLYSTLGIPIARRADRGDRVTIITASLLIWSAFTALTGLARNFTHFLLARLAVGIGEAGCSPPAYSLIADYFPPERRATAVSIYSMGIYAGVFVGLVVGGEVAQAFGWRAAFFVVGLPGVLLALVVRLTLREPPRGFSEPTAVAAPAAPFGEVVAGLWQKPSFRHLSLAAALHAFVGYGVTGFYPTFMIRSHGMSVAEVGRWMALVTALGGITGTYLGGLWAERGVKRTGDERHQLWVPGISTLISVPISLLIYVVSDKYIALALMFPAGVLGAMYLGPTFAVTLRLANVRERALAGAILLLIMNLIGLGLGPLLTGALSDAFRSYFTQHGRALEPAIADGLRCALAVMTFVNLWSALHYSIASRSLRSDLDQSK